MTFRAAFSAEDESEAWVACSRATKIIDDMKTEYQTDDVELWLSGKNNFRYSVYPEYKANRITAKRPRWEQEVRDYLIQVEGASVSDGCEADDMLGVRMYQLERPVCCSIDKDLDQLVGEHYNFVKKEKYIVTNEDAIRFFYYQCLVGDTADGIKGVPGIGPKKANNILSQAAEKALCGGSEIEYEYYKAVRDCYSCYEEFEMNAKVLWIWKAPDDIWKDNFKEQYEALDTSTT